MSASLVGSEMCIRDSAWVLPRGHRRRGRGCEAAQHLGYAAVVGIPSSMNCLLYTSDAADDM
eukprot:8495400-Alexandrium_andersonii.AAC.1